MGIADYKLAQAQAKKVKAAPKKSGPIQPAFPLEMYEQQNPWGGLIDQPLAATDVPPPVEVPAYTYQDMDGTGDRVAAEPMVYPKFGEPRYTPREAMLPSQLTAPVVPNVPGAFGEHKLSSDLTKKDATKTDTRLSAEDFGQWANQMAGTPQFMALQEALANRERMAQDTFERMPVQMDYSPLMALADAWTGSNLAASYKKPSYGPLEKAKIMLDYADKSTDDKRKLVEDLTRTFQQAKTGSQTSELINKLAESLAVGQRTPRPQQNQGKADINQRWFAGKAQDESVKFNEMNKQFNKIEQLLSTRNMGSIMSQLSVIAKTIGGESGMLTNQDIARVMPDTLEKTVANFVQYITSNPQKLDNKLVDNLISDVRTARQIQTQAFKDRLAQLKGAVIAAPALSSTIPAEAMTKEYADQLNKAGESNLKTQKEQQAEILRDIFK